MALGGSYQHSRQWALFELGCLCSVLYVAKPWAPDVALVGAKSRVADDVGHSPIVDANVHEPRAGAVLAGNLDVQEASALVDTRYDAGVPGLHAEPGYVFRDGKDTVLPVIAERRDERPAR